MRRNAAGGFTLLELTCALFILTFGMFGVIQMYHLGMAKTRVLNEYTQAMEALQNELETLRALPFESLRNVKHGPFVTQPRVLRRLVNARPRTTIRDYPESGGALKEVRVTLKWTSENGRTITKRLVTLIAQRTALERVTRS